VWFEGFIVASVNIAVIWDVMPCSVVDGLPTFWSDLLPHSARHNE
jgi:hypothetical protein